MPSRLGRFLPFHLMRNDYVTRPFVCFPWTFDQNDPQMTKSGSKSRKKSTISFSIGDDEMSLNKSFRPETRRRRMYEYSLAQVQNLLAATLGPRLCAVTAYNRQLKMLPHVSNEETHLCATLHDSLPKSPKRPDNGAKNGQKTGKIDELHL